MGSFGERLKKEREQRSITLDDISLSTKIGTRLLRALEEEKFDQLPGGIFNKGFVRAYARHVGLDEEQAIADYMEALGESQVKASVEAESAAKTLPPAEIRMPVREKRENQTASQIPWGLLALLLVTIALAFASWNSYHRDRTAEPRNPSANLPAPSVSNRPASSEQASPPVETSAASTSQPSSAAAGAFTVLLKGNDSAEESWVSIAVDGQAPTEVTLSGPTQKEIQATREVILKAGNAGALDFYFNGKKLPPQGGIGVVRTLTFRPDGLQAPPPKPVPAPAP